METVLHVAAQAVDDCKTLLAPFLPHTAQRIDEQLGREGRFTDRPDVREVDDLDGGDGYPVLMLDGDRGTGHWESTPIVPYISITAPTPIFAKLCPVGRRQRAVPPRSTRVSPPWRGTPCWIDSHSHVYDTRLDRGPDAGDRALQRWAR